MGTIVASSLMSLILMTIGWFTLKKSISGNMSAADVGFMVGFLGMTAGMLGLAICGMFWTHSQRLARIEKALDRPK